jgi:prepilin-type processing-associated H-X9-DG protein
VLPDDLRLWVEDVLGGRVTESGRIGSGASRVIWRVVVDRHPYVVRVDTGDGPVAGTPLDLAREAAVYAALDGRGLPVPALHAVAPDGRALLMAHADGADALAIADDDERAAVGDDYLRCLARLHQLPVDELALDRLGPTTDLELWTAIHAERAAPYAGPWSAFALEWLAANLPPIALPVLCHGDAGPGNFLYADGRVTALLDWEFAHLGDPHDDLAWVTVRNHLLGRPMDVPTAFDAWRGATGRAIDVDLLERYRVFVLVRMAISCDATVAWKGGAEDDESIRTQVLLRPWLARALAAALALAGCDSAEFASVAAEADARFEASPHRELLGLIPPLAPMKELA